MAEHNTTKAKSVKRLQESSSDEWSRATAQGISAASAYSREGVSYAVEPDVAYTTTGERCSGRCSGGTSPCSRRPLSKSPSDRRHFSKNHYHSSHCQVAHARLYICIPYLSEVGGSSGKCWRLPEKNRAIRVQHQAKKWQPITRQHPLPRTLVISFWFGNLLADNSEIGMM